MPYAIFGYNHSVHSVTNQKPIDVINGHLDSKDPLDIDLNKELVNNYITEHKQKTRIMFNKIHENDQIRKEANIEKRNQNRQDPITFSENQIAFRKNVKSRNNKLNPPFSKETVVADEGIKLRTERNTYHKNIFKKPHTSSNLFQGDTRPLDDNPPNTSKEC